MLTFWVAYVLIGLAVGTLNAVSPVTQALIRRRLEDQGCRREWVFGWAVFVNAVFIAVVWPYALGTILGRLR